MFSRQAVGRGRRVIIAAATLPMAIALIAGCSNHGTSTAADPAGASTTTAPATASPGTTSGSTSTTSSQKTTSGQSQTGSSSSRGSSSSSDSSSHHSRRGCAPGGAAVPAGAASTTTGDLDGDGKADRLWLAHAGTTRLVGVTTASGARFSAPLLDVAAPNARARANRLADGSSVILLDLNRDMRVYALSNCAIVPSRDQQGEQFTFDTQQGSGVGCPVIGPGRRLVSYLAQPTGDTFTVTRTTINISHDGTRALNGATITLGTKQPASSPLVRLANSVTCGTSREVIEPLS